MRYPYLKDKKHRIIFCFIIGIIVVLNFEAICSKEISPEEALQWGIINNLDLQTIRYNIEDLQRNLEIVEAGKSFQIDLSITPIWYFAGKNNSQQIEVGENRFAPDTELSLSINKILAPNLTFSSEVSWQSENFMNSFLENIVNEVNASIKLNQKLYPNSWSEQEKQIYSLENNLKMKLDELKWTEVEKQIEFIQKYLAIVRLQEQLDIISEQIKQVEGELERVKAQMELGEGGYQQEAEVVIKLLDVKDKHWSLASDLLQAKKQWYLLLNLPDEITVNFTSDNIFLNDISRQMENLPLNNKTREELVSLTLQENYQIKNSQIEKDELLKELQWTKDDGKPAVNVSGGYSYPDSDWFVMFDFRINLSDGGAQKLKENQKEENLRRKGISIEYMTTMLRLEAEQLLDKDEYNQLILETQMISLKKEQEKDKIIEQQYQKGAISIIQRESNLLSLKERELSVKQSYDQWLINRLKLAHFIGFLPKGV